VHVHLSWGIAVIINDIFLCLSWLPHTGQSCLAYQGRRGWPTAFWRIRLQSVIIAYKRRYNSKSHTLQLLLLLLLLLLFYLFIVVVQYSSTIC
jgi:hypothetical protein